MLGMANSPGLLNSKALKEGQISLDQMSWRDERKFGEKAVMSIRVSFRSSESPGPLAAVLVSKIASLESKMILPLLSICRWFRSNPEAPPSSNSAEVFLNSGSTENSSSYCLTSRASQLLSTVF